MKTLHDKNEFQPYLIEVEESPVSPLGRMLLWILLALFVLTILWLSLSKTDIVVTAKAKSIPVGDILKIEAFQDGAIEKIYVQTGDVVKKGDPLIVIDSTLQTTKMEANLNNKQLVELEMQKIKSLLKNQKFTMPDETPIRMRNLLQGMYSNDKKILLDNLDKIELEQEQKKEAISNAKTNKLTIQKLFRLSQDELQRLSPVRHLISKQEYETALKSNLANKIQFQEQKDKIRQFSKDVKILKNKKKKILNEFYNKLYFDLMQKEKELEILKSDVKSYAFKKAKQVVRATVNGVIGKVYVNTIGGVVTKKEQLLLIVPENTPLLFKARVSSKKIGKIKKGMACSIKVDTYEYLRYGILDAQIVKISSTVTEDAEDGLFYEVFVAPKQTYLTKNEKKYAIFAGMSASVDIKVGKRTILDFFIDPLIKNFDEAVSVE